jgi:hypothetical protein
MFRFIVVLLSVAVAFLSAGCTAKHGHLPVIIMDSDEVPEGYEKVEDEVVGKDIIHVYVIFPTGAYPRLDDAVRDAVGDRPGALLRNVDITYRWYMIPPLYARSWMEVTGELWQKKEEREAPAGGG